MLNPDFRRGIVYLVVKISKFSKLVKKPDYTDAAGRQAVVEESSVSFSVPSIQSEKVSLLPV